MHFRVGPLETTVQGNMGIECLILIQSLNERMVELECPVLLAKLSFIMCQMASLLKL